MSRAHRAQRAVTQTSERTPQRPRAVRSVTNAMCLPALGGRSLYCEPLDNWLAARVLPTTRSETGRRPNVSRSGRQIGLCAIFGLGLLFEGRRLSNWRFGASIRLSGGMLPGIGARNKDPVPSHSQTLLSLHMRTTNGWQQTSSASQPWRQSPFGAYVRDCPSWPTLPSNKHDIAVSPPPKGRSTLHQCIGHEASLLTSRIIKRIPIHHCQPELAEP